MGVHESTSRRPSNLCWKMLKASPTPALRACRRMAISLVCLLRKPISERQTGVLVSKFSSNGSSGAPWVKRKWAVSAAFSVINCGWMRSLGLNTMASG
ncbi:hypothetical protein D9M69_723650 [compost metagenome]